jgi:pimeloyl-ACP methyl ester carboxylesterase
MTAPSVPVLLVHGFASSFELNWREPGWVDLLADAGRDVIPVDLLGHGTAPKPYEPEAYAHLESRAAEALPAEGQVDAIGFSMGASTLLRLATQQPDRFQRIVVGGIGGGVIGEGTRPEGEEGIGDPDALARAVETGEAPPGGVAQLFAQFAQVPGNDRKALAACLRRTDTPLTRDDLARVTCPVLVVIGDKDFAGPADPLVDALPDARLVVLRNTEHFATPRSFGFIDAALEFLDAVPD